MKEKGIGIGFVVDEIEVINVFKWNGISRIVATMKIKGDKIHVSKCV